MKETPLVPVSKKHKKGLLYNSCNKQSKKLTYVRINSFTCLKFYLGKVKQSSLWQEVDKSSRRCMWVVLQRGSKNPKTQLTASGRTGNGEARVRDSAEAYRGISVF